MKKSTYLFLVLFMLLFLTVPIFQASIERAEADTVYHIYLPLVLSTLNAKKGVFITHGACQDASLLRTSWYAATEGVRPPAGCSQSDRRFVPIIHDAAAMAELDAAIRNAQVSGWLKGFTEPNLQSQANISPADAAQLWRQIEMAADAAGGIKLVSPSPSQHDPGWLFRMVDEYQTRYGRKPRFDAIAWNYYYAPDDGYRDSVMEFLTKRHNDALALGYNVPIWVMEYGGECWHDGKYNVEVMTSQTPQFGQTPWIERYAWFANRLYGTEPWATGWESCSLVNPSTGALKALGEIYQGY